MTTTTDFDKPPKLEPDGPAPEPMATPSPTFYSQLAADLIASLDGFTAAVPDFDNPLRLSIAFVKAKRRLPKAFVIDAVAALLVSGELQGLRISNTAEVLDDQQYIDAFVPLARHLDTALKGLNFSIQAREARLAANAQKIYTTAKALAQDREGTTIGVHVENMKRSRRQPVRRKTKPEPQLLLTRKEGPDITSR